MARANLIILSVLLLSIMCVGISTFYFSDHYLLISFLLVTLSILPFYYRFQVRKMDTREIVLIAILSAIAAVSRIPFAPIPNVKPVSFIIMVSAMVFGKEAGFIIGSTAALVSNIFFGQGPWTPWQMFAWGMVGFVTGLMKDTKWMTWRLGQAAYGFVWGFVFDWFMNLSVMINFVKDFQWQALIATYMAGFYFDLAHACSNALFLYFFGASWLKILDRFKRKYGLLTQES
ncbi:MAG TPA: ECF transporter S component [Bacillota bacterium]|nr:ECF transporter S component [Bacillota bacterium]